ncbi:hypothetical protein [Pedobacter sp. BMA]|uniref:hypothetical protein n=1 Tax=Pedobacter sp. BMA TaxID=1663685 RepID=UPI00069F07AA|nr:hypothetical protein [Pedobacter sp. BMA]
MENQENIQPEEEIANLEQFQVGRSEGSAADGHSLPENDEYTAEEVQYADGEGTRLNEELGPDDEEDDDDLIDGDDLETDEDAEDIEETDDSDVEELDKDLNAYDEDDSEML